jgi:putative lipoic acid-binding regulatory protein
MKPEARPAPTFPQRVPLKIIGRGAEMDPARIADLIRQHLGPQPAADLAHGTNQRGAYTSFTFWVTQPDAEAERPLRAAIQALEGVVMQL